MSDEQLQFEDYFLEELEPTESESDLETLLTSDLTNAVVQATDWTTETLLNQIEKGRIYFNPSFQRRDAWTPDRKSKFIESLLLGFPIPQIVLAESQNERGSYIIIDGKQRLLSLVQFAGSGRPPNEYERLTLTGLEILRDLNGKTIDEITQTDKMSIRTAEFENRTIRTIVIRHWKNDAILYHIFLRLNTGSVQLSPQELRNALHPGPFAEFIDLYSGESQALRRILKTSKPDFRMRDAELLLRYYAFRNFITRYSGSMKDFLDMTTKEFNLLWPNMENEIRQQVYQFENAVDLAYFVFGEGDVFRKWKNGQFTGRFNRAVYDVIMYHFWKQDLIEAIRDHRQEIKDAFIDLSQASDEFIDSIESTTKSLTATVTRLSLWTNTLSRVIDIHLPGINLVGKRIRPE